MKKYASLALVLVLTLSMAGCFRRKDPKPTDTVTMPTGNYTTEPSTTPATRPTTQPTTAPTIPSVAPTMPNSTDESGTEGTTEATSAGQTQRSNQGRSIGGR
jgi:hypothetical protein